MPGIDVKGKIVLAYKGSPESFTPPPRHVRRTPPQPPPRRRWAWRTEETTDAAKIKTAFDKGAAAILLYDPNPIPGRRRLMIMGGPMGGNAPAALTRNFLAFDVTERVFRALMRKSPQASASEFGKIAQRHPLGHPQQEAPLQGHGRLGRPQGL